MPNEALIVTLENLRESYSQQQKAAANLQSAYKGLLASLNKGGKSLKEYGAQNTGIDSGQFARAQSAFSALRLKDEAIDPLLPDLRRELKSLAHLTAALRDAAVALKVEPVDVVRLVHAYGVLQTAQQKDIVDLLPELSEELQVAQVALGNVFGQALRDALAEQGIGIAGRSPKFEIGRFEIDANFAKRAAVIRYGKDMVIPRVPTSLEAVLKGYQSAAKLVTGRSEDGEQWMNQFYAAYEFARRKRDVSGARVNIVDCYLEMVLLRQGRAFTSEPSKRTFADYSRAQFSYDFYEFAGRQRRAANGLVAAAHVASKSQTDSPAKSMWIVEGDGPYDGRYISDIEFEKA